MRWSARMSCAALLAADPASVGLGVGTFQLWTALMGRMPLRQGRILVAEHEWGDHVRWLKRIAASTNIELDVITDDALDPSAWAARIDDDVVAICLPIVTSVEGLRYPVREIAKLPRPADALVVVDAAQALGRVCVDPSDMGCDVVVCTTRKWLRGPRQTAMFWMSARAKRVLDCGVHDVEPLDLNIALLAGLARAAKIARERTITAINHEITSLDAQLRLGLTDACGIQLVPSATPGTILCKVSWDAREAYNARLREHGIVAKWCKAFHDEPLSNDRNETALLRISPHVYNTCHEVATVVNALNLESRKRSP